MRPALQGRELAPLAAAALIALAGCSEPAAEVVDGDRIVVAAAPETWERIGPRIERALEPTPFAIPDENAFDLEITDPAAETWPEMREAPQLLLIGSPEDPWIAEALERRRIEAPAVPSQIELPDLWDAGQYAVVLLVDAESRPNERQMTDLRARFDKHYREFIVERMYFPGGPNAALADTLQRLGGFDLLLPAGYRWTQREEVFLFEPPLDDSSGVERHILVAWQSPIPAGVESDARALIEWRERVSREHYGDRQTVDPTGVHGGPTTQRGARALQLLGSWRGGGESGPFLLRGVVCPIQDRMYLLDGWMPAPADEGQEYMVEIESILNSFRCGSAEG